MKRMWIAALVSCVLAWAGRADPITLADNNPADVYLIVGLNPTYSGQFDLRPAFDPATMTILDATVEFTFWDAPLIGGSEAGRVQWNLSNSNPTIGTFASFSGLFSLGGDVTGAALGELDANGFLNYTVTITRGETWLTNANLTAVVAVPERTTTLILIGLGTIAISCISRRQLTPIRA